MASGGKVDQQALSRWAHNTHKVYQRRRGSLRRPIETAVRALQLSSWFKDEGKGQESRNLEKLQKQKKKKKLKKVDSPQPQECPEKHLCNPMEPLLDF